MSSLGYLVAIVGVVLLYDNSLAFGLILFFMGGALAGDLKISIPSLGIMIVVGGIAYGFHNGFSDPVIVAIFVGLILSVGRSISGSGAEADIGDTYDNSCSRRDDRRDDKSHYDCGSSDGVDGGD